MMLSPAITMENAAPRPSEPVVPPQKLYQRVQAADPERMSGSIVRYDSFADFLTTAEEEAKDPGVVGAADILDIINPLQHLPLVGHIYRGLTGDTIKPVSGILGGAVFGGGVGLASASVGAVVREETGGDIGQALFSGPALREEDRTGPDRVVIEPDTTQIRRATSAYREIEPRGAGRPDGGQRVVMADPERMAGSFIRYG